MYIRIVLNYIFILSLKTPEDGLSSILLVVLYLSKNMCIYCSDPDENC